MGYPPFIDANQLEWSKWLLRGEAALKSHGFNPGIAFDVAAEMMQLWQDGQHQGEMLYLQMLWDQDPGGWHAEHMFWSYTMTFTTRYVANMYKDAFEILMRAESVELDEWGIPL